MNDVASFCPSNNFNLHQLDWRGPLCLGDAIVGLMPAGLPSMYVLQHWSGAGCRYVVYYVGKTVDLRRRLLEHLRGGGPAVKFSGTCGPIIFRRRSLFPRFSTMWSVR